MQLRTKKYHLDRNLAVHKVYKYEELEEALTDISEKLRLNEPLIMPSYRVKGNPRKDRRHFKEVLTLEQMKKIYNVNEQTFHLLDYDKGF